MRTFLAIVILATMHHYGIKDPTMPGIVLVSLCLGFFTAIAQDVKELLK